MNNKKILNDMKFLYKIELLEIVDSNIKQYNKCILNVDILENYWRNYFVKPFNVENDTLVKEYFNKVINDLKKLYDMETEGNILIIR